MESKSGVEFYIKRQLGTYYYSKFRPGEFKYNSFRIKKLFNINVKSKYMAALNLGQEPIFLLIDKWELISYLVTV